MNSFLLLIGLLYCSSILDLGREATRLDAPFDKLELRDLSQLRVEVRNIERPKQCMLFWRGVSERLSLQAGGQFTSTYDGLSQLGAAMKVRPSFQKMLDFVEGCAQSLSHEGKFHDSTPIEASLAKSGEELAAELYKYKERLSLSEKNLNQKNDEILKLRCDLDKYLQATIQLRIEKEAVIEQVSKLKRKLESKGSEDQLSADKQLEMLKKDLYDARKSEASVREEKGEIYGKLKSVTLELDDTKKKLDKVKEDLCYLTFNLFRGC